MFIEMKSSVLTNVEDHLILLQEKKRQRRRLETPDEKQVELERKEKGFTLYVNGANAEFPKTARTKPSHQTNATSESVSPVRKNRAQTAPSARTRRRQWQVASVDLKTCSGDRVKVRAPAGATENYAEDFEDEVSDESISEDDFESSHSGSVEEEIEIQHEEELADEFGDPGVVNKVLSCSPSDVKKLRQSLELSASLRLELPADSESKVSAKSSSVTQHSVNKPAAAAASREKCNPEMNENLTNLFDKIMHLDPRSQQQLMKLLSKLDDSPRKSTAWEDGDRMPALELQSAAGNTAAKSGSMLDTTELSADTRQSAALHPPVRTSSKKLPVTSQSRSRHKPIEIHIELLSNWGHPHRVGLTEIELLDRNSQKVDVNPSIDVSISPGASISSDISCLFNGKYKTIKEKYMWSCDVSYLPVTITVKLNQQPARNDIAMLRIWNFNHNTNDVSIGVRHMRVLVNQTLAFDGDITKGCANHIFDYDQTISLVQPSLSMSGRASAAEHSASYARHSRKSVHREVAASAADTTLSTSLSRSANTPAVPSLSVSMENVHDAASCDLSASSSSASMPTSARGRRRDRLQNQPPVTQSDDSLSSEMLAHVTSAPSLSFMSSFDNVSAAAVQSANTDSVADDKSSLTGNPAHAAELPSWLNNKSPVTSDSPYTSQTLQEESILDNWPRASISHLPTLLDVSESKTSSGDCLDEDDVTPMKQIESARAARRKRQNFSLEQSWTSLNLFNRCQKGRISLDLQDDILDEYLASERVKPSEQSIPELSKSTDTQMLQDFSIPELPFGQHMVINIKTTWGDRHYVGLSGIEIFANTGHPVNISKITANPSDINILPEYSTDPRVVTNLIDGVNRTQDDTHMWLTPFTSGQSHYIFITFERPACISVMRIWNYNKSRIHSSRGAKDIEITLDATTIFVGEIARACGGMIGSSDSFGDTILFTMDEEILELVASYDQTFEVDASDGFSILDDICDRPSTADGTRDETDRPMTSASRAIVDHSKLSHRDDNGDVVYDGKDLVLNLTETWGDLHYIGLTGLEVVGKQGDAIPVDMNMIDAEPKDLHHLPGHEEDDRTLDKLINGTNVTTRDEHMWLVPFVDGSNHETRIHFNQIMPITGLRLWNYNKSPEDTFRGVHTMHVSLDGHCLSPPQGFLIRKGPGNCFFDFAQQISFGRNVSYSVNKAVTSSSINPAGGQYDYVAKPCGFIYQLQLLSSYGDPYYIGLNGLEIYDNNGHLIVLTETNIAAYPESVNILSDVKHDIRTPDKLIDGVNDTVDGRHMWLAPILPNVVNRVYVIFDEPVQFSMLRIWNYSKTPARGVQDMALLVDDLLVYNGTLEMVSGNKSSKCHTIIFSDNADIAHRDLQEATVDLEEQQIHLLNDRKVIPSQGVAAPQKSQTKIADQALRPTTSMPKGRLSVK